MIERGRFFHGSKHPYARGDLVVPGEVGGSAEEYDDHLRVWACESAEEAARWAAQRHCPCGTDRDHRPRVFEVDLNGVERDPNVRPPRVSLMAESALVVGEIEMSAESFRRW